MAKGSGRLSDFDYDETGGALSGLLAEEDDLDRRALWRLGTWAAVSVGAVIVALITNQSSIGMRREQTAAADLVRQTQQVQLAAKETQGEARRLASAIETLNGDRDRLYSRVAVLEQGLDSVTGAIVRQNSTPPPPSPQASASPAAATAVGPSAASSASAAPAASSPTGPPASVAPAATASVDPPPAAAKPTPAPVVAPVAATTAAVADKQASVVASEPNQTVASVPAPKPAAAQPSGSLMAAKSMMAPPDPAAGKLIESPTPPKTVTSAPMPEIVAVAPTTPEAAEPDSAATVAETVVRRTEFGVDVGGANSIPGLRALWRGLLRSRSNAALTTLRPIIVIKENGNGLGMQLRLVAGPIGDAAAAAKVCASLTVNDRNCTTAVFEGQRLAMSADEQARMDANANKTDINRTDSNNTDANSAESGTPAFAKPSFHKRVAARHPKEDAPKSEPSTLSLIFGKH
jgi:hypothetical protein